MIWNFTITLILVFQSAKNLLCRKVALMFHLELLKPLFTTRGIMITILTAQGHDEVSCAL